MKASGIIRRLWGAALAALLALPSSVTAQASQPGAAKGDIPFEVILDINSRQQPVYDGYTQYVKAYRVSPEDTFHVVKDSYDVDLSSVVMDYFIITYGEEGTQISQECTVYGLEEGYSYPLVRQETVAREEAAGQLYDHLSRCYVLKFTVGDQSESFYFQLFSPEHIDEYRNLIKGNWKQDTKGTRYWYEGDYLKSWALINGAWYLFGDDGYMDRGWQEYKGEWYYLDKADGKMRTDCIVDGYQIDESGVRA